DRHGRREAPERLEGRDGPGARRRAAESAVRPRDKLASGSLGEPRQGEVLLTFPGEEEGRRPPARKPRWLLKPVPNPAGIRRIRGLLDELRRNPVGEDAGGPHRRQGWNDGRATLMIRGSHCSGR